MADTGENTVSLTEAFERAANHMKTLVGQLGNDKLLELYAYYKQAKEGSCCIPRPHWFELTAKQKWEAWKELGNMDQETAMKNYISSVSALDPGWELRYSKEQTEDKENAVHNIGWVSVSCLPNTDDYIADDDKTVFDWVKEGNIDKVLELAQKQTVFAAVDDLDDCGMGLIHWAADRGSLSVCRGLLERLKANVNLQDGDGQTALHYASSCGHIDIVKYLLENGADKNITDSEGSLPLDVASDAEIEHILKL
ncbi:hypothetical protein R5R35_008220 [Gryllus longicercus]|uniref:Acyl-CoA-binding domain-containing protein 6 n=1 Tax=Gryllus longicercus TaxID=2509291 RepID=A0AAN9VP48_9ORTH